MTFYLIFKVVHIFAMVSWMAGMLYLPRIFVYHSNKNNSKEMNETFVTMEYKTFKIYNESCNDCYLGIWNSTFDSSLF